VKYTYPNGFDRVRAQELGTLVDAAYQQLQQGQAWQPPAGYKILATLSAKELWKTRGLAPELVAHLLKAVPFGFVAQKGADLYVVIRGTVTPLEWLDDFSIHPVPFAPSGKPWGNTTHGFKALYDNLGPQISQALHAVQAQGGTLQSILVTGHSLGAALAHLAAAGLNAEFGVRPVSYTFCGPRAGDPPFADAFVAANLQTWRVFNTEDIVPTVPPAAVKLLDATVQSLSPLGLLLDRFLQLFPAGYQHVGYPIAATFHQTTVAGNHNLDRLCAEINS
jgi:triacylglycerol lipase